MRVTFGFLFGLLITATSIARVDVQAASGDAIGVCGRPDHRRYGSAAARRRGDGRAGRKNCRDRDGGERHNSPGGNARQPRRPDDHAGMINAHGHVNDVQGSRPAPEFYTPSTSSISSPSTRATAVTTVFSLGGDGPAGVQVRDEKASGIARLFVAGPVIASPDPEAGRRAVDGVKAMNADLVKIRVDDNLGAGKKMPAEAYRAVIDQAHTQGLKVAAHIFYLGGCHRCSRRGRDYRRAQRARPAGRPRVHRPVEGPWTVCLCPTLMRDVATFVYADSPGVLRRSVRQARGRCRNSGRAPDAAAPGIESHALRPKDTRLVSKWPRPTCKNAERREDTHRDGHSHGACGALSGLFRTPRARADGHCRTDADAGGRGGNGRRSPLHEHRRSASARC